MKRLLIYSSLIFVILITGLEYNLLKVKYNLRAIGDDMDYIDGKYAMPLAQLDLEIKRLDHKLSVLEEQRIKRHGK